MSVFIVVYRGRSINTSCRGRYVHYVFVEGAKLSVSGDRIVDSESVL